MLFLCIFCLPVVVVIGDLCIRSLCRYCCYVVVVCFTCVVVLLSVACNL